MSLVIRLLTRLLFAFRPYRESGVTAYNDICLWFIIKSHIDEVNKREGEYVNVTDIMLTERD